MNVDIIRIDLAPLERVEWPADWRMPAQGDAVVTDSGRYQVDRVVFDLQAPPMIRLYVTAAPGAEQAMWGLTASEEQ
jgi:hypothetical protein